MFKSLPADDDELTIKFHRYLTVQRVAARRGMQVAVFAAARKLTVLCWHLIIKAEDYAYAQPALVAHKRRKLKLDGRGLGRGGVHRPQRGGRCVHRPPRVPGQDRLPWARKNRIISADASGPMGSV